MAFEKHLKKSSLEKQTLPLLDVFLNNLKCSTNTRLAYKQDLSIYGEFVLTPNSNNIKDFILFMNRRGLSPRSQARVISSLKKYFKFLRANQIQHQDYKEFWSEFYRFSTPYIPPPQVLTIDVFEKLYKACKADSPFKSIRNQITLLMLFDLGLRVTQLINLNLQDFNTDKNVMRILKKDNQKEHTIPLSHLLSHHLKLYLSKSRKHFKPDKSTNSILLNDKGKRPSRIDLWRWLSIWSKAAGLNETISPQQFRHGFAVALYKSGADLKSIQKLLGHSRLENTKIYQSVITDEDESDPLKLVINDHHPLSRSSFYKSKNSF